MPMNYENCHHNDIENPAEDEDHDPMVEHPQPLNNVLVGYKVLLYKAALSGDWKAAKQIHNLHGDCFTESITEDGDTALHIAAVAGHFKFVDALVDLMVPLAGSSYLAKKNDHGNTALFLAATSGVVPIAKKILEKNKELLRQRGQADFTPLHLAICVGQRKMVQYLLEAQRNYDQNDFTVQERTTLFFEAIRSRLYDIALEMLEGHIDELATAREPPYPEQTQVQHQQIRETPLHILAQQSFPSQPGFWPKCFRLNVFGGKEKKAIQAKKLELVERIWKRVLQEPKKVRSELMEQPSPLIFDAVKMGNVEFVRTLVGNYPHLIWKWNEDEPRRTIFHTAIEFRQERIFQLIYELGCIKDLLAVYCDLKTRNNMLHLAALLPSSDRLNTISGAALQMQREIWWFKKVEELVPPSFSSAENKDKKTPKRLFTETHEGLRKEGEQWMRNTATSSSVVATLIASVMFAALRVPAFQEDASDNLVSHRGVQYWMLAMFDAVSLISSTASILMFQSILSSRYEEQDFLQSLPLKLMTGITLLFISIAAMMASFTVAFSIIFKHGLLWVGIAVLASVPIILFAIQQLPLLLAVSRSTFGYRKRSTLKITGVTSQELSELLIK